MILKIPGNVIYCLLDCSLFVACVVVVVVVGCAVAAFLLFLHEQDRSMIGGKTQTRHSLSVCLCCLKNTKEKKGKGKESTNRIQHTAGSNFSEHAVPVGP